MINKHKEQNSEIIPILLGDWNEEFTTTSIPAQICNDFNLVNIFERMHPDHEKFKTYKRGNSVIDFVLAPPEIADSVTNFVYEPFLYQLKGDHRAFYFDIPEEVLFGDAPEPVFNNNGRGFSSKDIKNVAIYLTKVHEHFCAQNIFVRLQRLINNDSPNHGEA